jgi:hypothetical protein
MWQKAGEVSDGKIPIQGSLTNIPFKLPQRPQADAAIANSSEQEKHALANEHHIAYSEGAAGVRSAKYPKPIIADGRIDAFSPVR